MRPLPEVLRRAAAWDRVCITSFSARRLAAVRRVLPRPVCMATSPVGVAALQLGEPRRALAQRLRRLSVAARFRSGLRPNRSCVTRTRRACRCTCGPSTTAGS